ncbi:MAG: phosphodiester glycosidase family protein [Oscillospiraceae bacterium]|nr:phosphodiester glycosidase family protein [Oscillospiraceae bacterium]MBQ4316125.1 phosphodiester glycosidase family protein [Oscillospiraceae bacterium]
MTSNVFKGGKMYSVPMNDIEHIGYFGAKNGNEEVKSAYARITKLRGRAPDFLFNAELFDFETRKAASDVVSGGVIHRLTEGYGIAFPDNKTAVFSYKNNVGAADYIGAYPVLVRNGKEETAVPAGISGRRGRTAIGVSESTLFIALLPDSGGATPAELRRAFVSFGAVNAINLDGGGSTQFYAPLGNHFSGRRVRGFIGVWIRGGDIRYVKVRTSLNVRSGAGILNKRVGKLYNGDAVTVLEEKNGWARIAAGWVSAKYLVKKR